MTKTKIEIQSEYRNKVLGEFGPKLDEVLEFGKTGMSNHSMINRLLRAAVNLYIEIEDDKKEELMVNFGRTIQDIEYEDELESLEDA